MLKNIQNVAILGLKSHRKQANSQIQRLHLMYSHMQRPMSQYKHKYIKNYKQTENKNKKW